MTTLPYPKPTTREMARSNAVYYAEEAAINMQPGGMVERVRFYLEASKTWAAIASTFIDDDLVQILADDIPVPGYPPLTDGPEPVVGVDYADPDATSVMQAPVQPSVGHVNRSGRIGGMDGTLVVDAVAWDVLRTLGIRYVLGSINRGVTIDLNDEDTEAVAWELQFSRMPDSPVVHVSVNRPPGRNPA